MREREECECTSRGRGRGSTVGREWLQQPQLISAGQGVGQREGEVAEHVCGICILSIVVVIVVVVFAFTVALWKMLQNTAECVVVGRGVWAEAKRVANLLLCVL